jgi:hypothetical protein
LVGILLVLASVVGVGWLVRSAQHTDAVWSAAVDLPVGAKVSGEDLVAVVVPLGRACKHYLSADTGLEPGARVLTPITKGELIPASGLGTPDPDGRRPVAVTLEGGVPVGVERGSRVDLYATPVSVAGKETAESRVLLSDVEVTSLSTQETSLGAQATTTVNLLVAPDSVADFIRARGAGERLDVVALPAGGSR